MSEHSSELGDAERAASRLAVRYSRVVDQYRRAERLYRQAEAQYQAARQTAEGAESRSVNAQVTFEEATKRWEWANKVIVMAAAIDAANMSGGEDGCRQVSTGEHRAHLRNQGVELEGMDVDHIVPKSLGGADHPSNYQLLDSSTNRSLGNTWDVVKCVSAGPKCLAAIASSFVCGSYAGPLP